MNHPSGHSRPVLPVRAAMALALILPLAFIAGCASNKNKSREDQVGIQVRDTAEHFSGNYQVDEDTGRYVARDDNRFSVKDFQADNNTFNVDDYSRKKFNASNNKQDGQPYATKAYDRESFSKASSRYQNQSSTEGNQTVPHTSSKYQGAAAQGIGSYTGNKSFTSKRDSAGADALKDVSPGTSKATPAGESSTNLDIGDIRQLLNKGG